MIPRWTKFPRKKSIAVDTAILLQSENLLNLGRAVLSASFLHTYLALSNVISSQQRVLCLTARGE
jgi:hypothetical protein